MWPLYQPIRTPEILKYCEISWDFTKKYFHLKSNAVYNSSAKKGLKSAAFCVRDQDATTVPETHMWEIGSSNGDQFMLQSSFFVIKQEWQ